MFIDQFRFACQDAIEADDVKLLNLWKQSYQVLSYTRMRSLDKAILG